MVPSKGPEYGLKRIECEEIQSADVEGLKLDEDGVAERGLIVRHLVLPEGLAGTEEVLNWIATVLSPRVHVSLIELLVALPVARFVTTPGATVSGTGNVFPLGLFDNPDQLGTSSAVFKAK
jgi:hypothetical protein